MKFLFVFLCFILSACSHHKENFYQAGVFNFSEYKIPSFPFLLTSYERVESDKELAHIYIEGDGRAWLSKSIASLDPTPKNPVAYKLAQQDPNKNVIYLARPCQFTKMIGELPCDKKYWTSHRFSSEVLKSMNNALDDIKRRHPIRHFHLFGYSGGANIAALLTAQRDDVVRLTTIAGNLDHQLQSKMHGVSEMPYSLNAKNIAKQISNIPQIHYVGEKDKIIFQAITKSYLTSAGLNHTDHLKIIPHVSHHEGWLEIWQKLLMHTSIYEK